MTSSPVDLFSQPTNYTDAVLLVEGRKMHVNKAALSYYSDFFNTLFNSDFSEKSMPKIPINDVKYEDLALLLGVFHREAPVLPTRDNAEKLLELADRFMMPYVTRQVEGFLLTDRPLLKSVIFFADKFRLETLLRTTIDAHTHQIGINQIMTHPDYKTLRDETKVRLLERMLFLKSWERKPLPISVDSDEDDDFSDEEISDEEISDEEEDCSDEESPDEF